MQKNEKNAIRYSDLSKHDQEVYSYVSMVLNRTITDSPLFADWSNAREGNNYTVNSEGFSKVFTFKFPVTNDVSLLLQKEGYWVNIVKDFSMTEIVEIA